MLASIRKLIGGAAADGAPSTKFIHERLQLVRTRDEEIKAELGRVHGRSDRGRHLKRLHEGLTAYGNGLHIVTVIDEAIAAGPGAVKQTSAAAEGAERDRQVAAAARAKAEAVWSGLAERKASLAGQIEAERAADDARVQAARLAHQQALASDDDEAVAETAAALDHAIDPADADKSLSRRAVLLATERLRAVEAVLGECAAAVNLHHERELEASALVKAHRTEAAAIAVDLMHLQAVRATAVSASLELVNRHFRIDLVSQWAVRAVEASRAVDLARLDGSAMWRLVEYMASGSTVEALEAVDPATLAAESPAAEAAAAGDLEQARRRMAELRLVINPQSGYPIDAVQMAGAEMRALSDRFGERLAA